MVELALVTPILAILLMAIFQFAFVLETQMGLTNAVREAARRAAAADSPTAAWVRAQLCGTDPSSCWDPSCATVAKDSCPLLPMNVQGFDGGRLVPANTVSVAFCTYNVNGVPNYRVDVAVRYGNPVFFPLLGYATDAVDGTPDGNWTLNASAEMRVERDLSPAPAGCS